jgi:hypothetical protein
MTEPEFASLKLMVKSQARKAENGAELLTACIEDGRYRNVSYITWAIRQFAPRHYKTVDARRLREYPPKPPAGVDLSDYKQPGKTAREIRQKEMGDRGEDIYDLPEYKRRGGVFR